jgi:hypothetical protein
VFPQEHFLLVMHRAGKLSEPSRPWISGSKPAWWRCVRVHGKCNANRPVNSPLQVTRVLDVAKKSVDRDLYPELVVGNPVHGIRQGFAIANSPAR